MSVWHLAISIIILEVLKHNNVPEKAYNQISQMKR